MNAVARTFEAKRVTPRKSSMSKPLEFAPTGGSANERAWKEHCSAPTYRH
jgi:hypothetical protein